MLNLLDILFPVECVWCWTHWAYICSECKKLLEAHPESCPFTHKPSAWYAVRYDLLSPSQEHYLEWIIVNFRFWPLIKELIMDLKYRHRSHTAWFLGKTLALWLQSHEILSQLLINNSQVLITYVPSHRIRHHFVKWYNQAHLLAKSLCRELSLDPPLKLCKKTKHTHSQVGMSKYKRETNLVDAFELVAHIPPQSTIVIVDDVLTSWSTMLELAKTIKHSQANCKIRWLTLARHG